MTREPKWDAWATASSVTLAVVAIDTLIVRSSGGRPIEAATRRRKAVSSKAGEPSVARGTLRSDQKPKLR